MLAYLKNILYNWTRHYTLNTEKTMSQVDPIPDPEELKRRRQPKYVVDQKDITVKDNLRAKQWAAEIMSRNESKLNANRFKNRQIVTSGDVKPESVDIMNIYPFPNLHWIIYRSDYGSNIMWSISLLSGKKLLFTSTFAKI